MSINKIPIKLFGLLFAFIPIINFSLLFMSDESQIFGNTGVMSNYGIYFLGISTFIIFISILLFKNYFWLFKLLISSFLLFIPLVFIYLDHSNITLIVLTVSSSFFLFLYTISYWKNEKDETVENDIPFVLIINSIIICSIIYLSFKFSLLNIEWNIVSISIYFSMYIVFFSMYMLRIKKNKLFVFLPPLTISLVFFVLFLNQANIVFLVIFVLSVFTLIEMLIMKNIVNVFLSQLFQNPFLLLLSSFVFLITVGTLLLILPYSSANNISISFIDSLFTSTSAVCVTGLVVMDTYTSFSIFGQIVIISLIQMGGLGIIIIMTFGSLIIGQRIGIRHEYIVSEMLGSKKIKFAYEIIKFIVITTFLFELTGAIALFYSFYSYENSIIIAIWKSIFHSISAFCNAGFALQSSSLIRYNNSPSILIVIMALIVSGGIGFPVLIYIKKILKKEISFSNVPVFVKISMLVTLSLILIGFFGLLLSEYQYSLKHLSFIDKLSNALFLSITPRTAGFNSTNMTDLSSSSIILIMFLMFIGGGSGSTAGGIKVTTFGVLIGVFISFIKGRKGVVLFNREISSLIVNRSVILLSFSIFLIIISTYILLINQNLNLTESLFEVVSAYGTVGLSLGTTAKLNSFGKFIIILLMYCGRVGLLSIFLLFIKEKKSNIRYTVENISVG